MGVFIKFVKEKERKIECYTLNRKRTTPMLFLNIRLKQTTSSFLSSRRTKSNISFYMIVNNKEIVSNERRRQKIGYMIITDKLKNIRDRKS